MVFAIVITNNDNITMYDNRSHTPHKKPSDRAAPPLSFEFRVGYNVLQLFLIGDDFTFSLGSYSGGVVVSTEDTPVIDTS